MVQNDLNDVPVGEEDDRTACVEVVVEVGCVCEGGFGEEGL